jgi:pimeloyl-ACP methyl ester carboxylesterase
MEAFPNYPKSDPKFYFSKNKIPGSPTIVFVHFFGGHQRVLKRHITLVNDLGFDAFAFNMPEFAGLRLSLFFRERFGLKHLYTHMIEFFLNQIEGQKILFAFSNPSAAAIEAIYDRQRNQRQDVVGLVCDSGPSLAFIRSAWNLAIRVKGEYLLLGLFAFFWSFRLHREIRYQLRRFPKNFPILSIRGEEDHIIPPWHIELVFKKLESYINVEVFNVPGAGHLDALKKFPEEYAARLSFWLNKHFNGKSLKN